MLHLWVEDALDRLAKYLFLSHWLSLLFLSLHHSFLFYHLRLYGNITPTVRKLNCPRYGRLNQENLSWRQEDGTDRVGLLSEKGGQESAPKTCPKPMPCLNMLICSALLSFIR